MVLAITGLMAMDTTERGLLRPSPLPMLLLMLLLRLIPGTDTMAMASTDLMAMDTTDTGLMAMDTTERGLLRLSLLPMLLLLLPLMLMLMPGMDTMAMAIDMAMVLAITGLMAMDTTERGLLRPSPLPMLLLMLLLRKSPADPSLEHAREHARKLSKSHRSTMPPQSVLRAAKINAPVADLSTQLGMLAASRNMTETRYSAAAHAGSGSPKERLKIDRMMQLTKARLYAHMFSALSASPPLNP